MFYRSGGGKDLTCTCGVSTIMGFWSEHEPIRMAAVSVYVLLACSPLLVWFFFSGQNVYHIMFGFTLLSFVTLMVMVSRSLFLAYAHYFFSLVLLPVFYMVVASGLQRKNRIGWSLALISNLLTISANVIWTRIYGTDRLTQETPAGLVFNLVVLTILILYRVTILKGQSK